MADAKISALTAQSAAIVDTDLLPMVDVSDTTMAPTGTTKKATALQVKTYIGAITASASGITDAVPVWTAAGAIGNSFLNSKSSYFAPRTIGALGIGNPSLDSGVADGRFSTLNLGTGGVIDWFGGDLTFRSSGQIRHRMASAGNISFGQVAVDANVLLKMFGYGATNSTSTLELRNASNQELAIFKNGRDISFGINGLSSNTGQTIWGQGASSFVGNATAIGFGANAAATRAVAVGDFSRAGNNSTIIGADAGKNNTGMAYGTAVGFSSLLNSNGSFNVAVGSFALLTSTTGDNCVALGHQAGYYETASNAFYIHNSLGVSDLATGKTNSMFYGVFNATNTLQRLYINCGLIGLRYLQTGNAGLSTGDLYVDTAANVLANGDKVVAWKV